MSNIKGMLYLAQDAGIKYLAAAYSNFMRHYDVHFTIANLAEEEKAFHDEMFAIGLLMKNKEGAYFIPELTIEEALELYDEFTTTNNPEA